VADQPKRKNPNAITKNSDRKNGKASKTTKASLPAHRTHEFHGSHNRGVVLTELQKVLLGGGALVRLRKPAPGNE
jgi:hypothetical protein